MINNNKRYPFKDNPFGITFKKKEKLHQEINSFDEFEEMHKTNLLKIKSVIINKIGECEIYVFGSMVNGTWDEESDYDLKVICNISKQDIEYLKNYDYGCKVDLFFDPRILLNVRKVII